MCGRDRDESGEPRGGLALALLLCTIPFAAACGKGAGGSADAAAAKLAAPAPTAVSALGRLEPGNRVVNVGAPQGDRLEKLAVREGMDVSAGDVIALLSSHDERRADVEVREAQLAQAQLEERRVGELDPLDTASLEADVRALEADLVLKTAELERSERLGSEGVDTTQSRQQKEAARADAVGRLDRARIALLRQKKQHELALGQARVALASARGELRSARARLARTEIRAPLSGRILRILTWPGEATTEMTPILRMGDTSAMFAVAEVYETDVRFVRAGQSALVKSTAFPELLKGRVETVGSLVFKNDVLDVDPTARTDTRVIEVRIRLDDATTAARYVHHQIEVSIDVAPAAQPSAAAKS